MKKLFIVSVLTLACAITARASVVGDNFQVQWDFPSLGTLGTAGDSGSITVPGTWTDPVYGDVVSISAGQIVFTDYAYGYAAGSFNGYVLTDLSEVPDFTSLTLVSVTGNALPITPGLSYTADSLAINLTPTGAANEPTVSGTAVYTFDFTTAGASVPEGSSTLMLLGMAMTGLAWLRRRLS
ncbi:MAG: hypothetical protein ABSD58_11600 [Verrucomicrobiia bacterium]|jgi:hypothetical protein